MYLDTPYIQKTEDITILVRPEYMENLSTLLGKTPHYVFKYTVQIINSPARDIQVLETNWSIRSGSDNDQQIKLEGILDELICLPAGDNHQFEDYYSLPHPAGNVRGCFVIKDLHTNKVFDVEIPLFFLRTTPVNIFKDPFQEKNVAM